MYQKVSDMNKLTLITFLLSFCLFSKSEGSFIDFESESSEVVLSPTRTYEIIADDISPDTEGSIEIDKSFMEIFEENLNFNWEISKTYGFDFLNDKNLYIFAFNVGQANFILLRKGNSAVIVDAGQGKKDELFTETAKDKASKLLSEIQNIEAIFITHPHDDHYSLLLPTSPIGRLFKITDATVLILGGSKNDWTGTGILELPPKSQIFSTDMSNWKQSFLGNAEFRIINSRPITKSSSVNAKSLILHVNFARNGILFTGDAEGINFDKIMPPAIDLKHAIETSKLFRKAPLETVQSWEKRIEGISPISSDFWTLYTEISEQTGMLPDIDEQKAITKEWQKYQESKTLLQTCSLCFLPHHGTRTEFSQRWIGAIGDHYPHCFVISSSPFGKDRLPKRSTIEFIPHNPVVDLHPVVYSRDSYLSSEKASIRTTTKPVYVTGIAPGGVECFLFSEDSPFALKKLDIFRRDDGKNFRWIDIGRIATTETTYPKVEELMCSIKEDLAENPFSDAWWFVSQRKELFEEGVISEKSGRLVQVKEGNLQLVEYDVKADENSGYYALGMNRRYAARALLYALNGKKKEFVLKIMSPISPKLTDTSIITEEQAIDFIEKNVLSKEPLFFERTKISVVDALAYLMNSKLKIIDFETGNTIHSFGDTYLFSETIYLIHKAGNYTVGLPA